MLRRFWLDPVQPFVPKLSTLAASWARSFGFRCERTSLNSSTKAAFTRSSWGEKFVQHIGLHGNRRQHMTARCVSVERQS